MGKLWREAEQFETSRDWSRAGAAWMDIAQRAWSKGDLVRTRDAAARAGDAARREDRPGFAARALKLAWDAGRRGPMDAALLAAVMLDAGEADVALDLVAGVEAGGDPSAAAVMLDVRLGLNIALGNVDAARDDIEALDRLDVSGAGISRVFRQAQVDRLDGDLTRADMGFTTVTSALAGMPAAVGPQAAALAERGELALLSAALGRGEPGAALPHLLGAQAGWKLAGRAGPALRAEAWVLRARALGGEQVLAGPILKWAAGAEERGVPLLAADLRVSYAIAAGDPAGLEAVLAALGRAPLARGRVRVIQAELGGAADLDAALGELQPDAPWFARGLRALGLREGSGAMSADADARIRAFFPPAG
ncbi:MAG: hypothetical protein EXR69_06905 [Myxococcales bacterium]|nr:hypothetical protein [Myxococcales bacterium]